MKKRKSIILSTVLLLSFVGVLAGCQSNENEDDATNQGSSGSVQQKDNVEDFDASEFDSIEGEDGSGILLPKGTNPEELDNLEGN
ncbi:hypothetical protein [Bacillus sp. 1P06AnD]|uniref:hypothetical protein n=1 Tax=Bacillus sp. 1P06AnD TaxID=3132208 RepID=UPI0039A093B2